VDIPKWPFTVASYVGAGLLSRLIDTAKLSLSDDSNGEAAFFHSYEAGENGWQVGHVKGHRKLFKLFKKYYIKHGVQRVGPFAQSVDIPKWPFTVASYVGAGLLSRLIDTAKLSLSDDSKLVALSNS
jgi:DNA-directed RNA polymerase